MRPTDNDRFHGYPIPISLTAISVDQLFELYRRYVIHQYELFNHRTNWYVALNAFLFGTYGFTLQKRLEVLARPPAQSTPDINAILAPVNMFLFALAMLGVLLSVLAWNLLKAASKPVKALFNEFEATMKANREALRMPSIQGAGETIVVVDVLPHIVGGFSEKYMDRGRTLTTYIPVLVGFIWMIILIFTVDYPSVWFDLKQPFVSLFPVGH